MTLKNIIIGGWNSLLDLFYPPVCLQCNVLLEENEQYLCADCLKQLPRTEMAAHRDNRLEQLFWDIPKLQRGAAFCFYRHGETFRKLVLRVKYNNQPLLGQYLAELAAREFLPTHFFDGIDLIVPVPLHPKRQRKRGYNQAEYIARGLSNITSIPLDTTHLKRIVNNPTQTKRDASERAQNTKGIFTVEMPANWRGKHILLVDDIVTTGSTIRSCIKVITPIQGTTISIFSLGLAARDLATTNSQLHSTLNSKH